MNMKLGYALLYVDDVKKTMTFYKKALKAGAKATSKSKPWGQVVSYIRDINGFLVEICSPM